MKKRSVVTKIIAAVFAIMILPFSPASGAVMQGKEKNSADVVYRGWIDTSGARRILTIHADSVQAADGTFGQLGEDVYLKSGDTLRLPVNLVNGGQYALLINYRVADGRMAVRLPLLRRTKPCLHPYMDYGRMKQKSIRTTDMAMRLLRIRGCFTNLLKIT